MNKFITFEGIDCCGKTTQIDLLSNYLLKNNQQSTIVREPGGTLISEKIRNILLDNNNFINSNTETLLFLSARSQLVNEIIAKSINNNFVLCDRYTDSTLAYQGYGRGISKNKIDILNEFATSGLNPDITFIFNLNLDESLNRMKKKKNIDRIEQAGKEFLNDVKEGYLEISKRDINRYKIIDCNNKSINTIHEEIICIVNEYYGL